MPGLGVRRTVFGTSRPAVIDMNNLVIGRRENVSNIDLFHGTVNISRRIREDPVKIPGVPFNTHYKVLNSQYHPEGFHVILPFDVWSPGFMVFHKIPLVVLSNLELRFEKLQQDYQVLTLGQGTLEQLKPSEQREIFMDMMSLVKTVKEETTSLTDLLMRTPGLVKSDQISKLLAKAQAGVEEQT